MPPNAVHVPPSPDEADAEPLPHDMQVAATLAAALIANDGTNSAERAVEYYASVLLALQQMPPEIADVE